MKKVEESDDNDSDDSDDDDVNESSNKNLNESKSPKIQDIWLNSLKTEK